MIDLTIVTYYCCSTSESWRKEVIGSSGKSYVVRWDSWNHPNRNVQFDYSCTCEAFKFRNGYCKHIKAAKIKRCGWGDSLEEYQPIEKDGEIFCPNCGATAFARGKGA